MNINQHPNTKKTRLMFAIDIEPDEDLQPFTILGKKHLVKKIYKYLTKYSKEHTEWWVSLKDISIEKVSGLLLDGKKIEPEEIEKNII